MNPVVKTRYGEVRGTTGHGINIFKGIPYAAPLFGANHLQPPQPVEPWCGVRDALEYGPTVPRAPYSPPFDKLIPDTIIPGEDCLNLNVWSPDLGQARLPVMVWIHGGGFTNGSGAELIYDGSHFARDGVVCITINYRLGAEGFLFLGDGIANLGLLDQVAALNWIQENIAAFGGDPDKVTIFGESAGGMSASTLLAMPSAAGLFHRVIAQSGAGHHVSSAATAQRIGRYLAERLGVEPTRNAIAAVPIDRLIQAQTALSIDFSANPDPERWGEALASGILFQPVIDGELLTARPIDSIAAGAGKTIDVMVGTTTEEWRLMMVPSDKITTTSKLMLINAVAAYGLPVPETLTTYRRTRKNDTPGDLLAAIITDWFFRIPAIRLAEAHTPGTGSTYMYEFAWQSSQFGACHGLEIPFVFKNMNSSDEWFGTKPPQQLADVMHQAWISFAKGGNPGWPQYDLTRRATMRFNATSEVVDDPRSSERILWEGRR